MKTMFEEVFGGGAFKGIYDVMNVSLLGVGSENPNLYNFINLLYINLMKPIALVLLVIFLVCALIEKTTSEQFTYEQMFLLFAKLIVGVFLIDKGLDLLIKFEDVGLAFLSDVNNIAKLGSISGTDNGYAVENNDALMELYHDWTGKDWEDKLSAWDQIKGFFNGGLALVVCWLLMFITKIIVYVVVFMRKLEYYIRTFFAPLALADFFYGGLNSTGFRFLKGFLAVSLQLACIYMVILFNTSISSDLAIGNNGTLFLIKYMGLTFATVGLIFKSQSLVKEFLGAS